MSIFILDTGALIALQRDHRRFRSLMEIVSSRKVRVRTSAPVLTEFLGGARPGARAAAEYVASSLDVASVDEAHARRAATLRQAAIDRAPRAEPSAVDALVAVEAERANGWLIVDGDRADFEALAQASGNIELLNLEEIA